MDRPVLYMPIIFELSRPIERLYKLEEPEACGNPSSELNVVKLFPLYFDNPQKLSCITAAMNLIKLLTAESQKNKNIFDLIVNFFVFIKKNNWIKDYIYWELELYKTIGYDLQFKDLVNKEKVGDEEVKYKTNKYGFISEISKK